MGDQRGQKLGWSLGWIGASIWMLIASVSFAFAETLELALAASGCWIVVVATSLSPWKKPNVKFWKLFATVYLLNMLAAVFLLYECKALDASGKGIRSLIPVLLIPLVVNITMGQWTWNDRYPTAAADEPFVPEMERGLPNR